MSVDTLIVQELTLANRPRQFRLMEAAADVFVQSDAVNHLSVRGSIAAGTADRMSDIDFVIGVEDSQFARFICILDALLTTELAAICSGWRDTIVRDMGGLGYVYLIVFENRLYQLDLYVVPSSRALAVQRHTHARVLFTRPEQPTTTSTIDLDGVIRSELIRPRCCADFLVESLVLVQMILKRIRRNQGFIVYSETCLLMNTLKDLIRTALAPESTSWGWYQLDEEIGGSPLGQACLAELSDLIALPPMRNPEQLRRIFGRMLGLFHQAAPETSRSLSMALDALAQYLELT